MKVDISCGSLEMFARGEITSVPCPVTPVSRNKATDMNDA